MVSRVSLSSLWVRLFLAALSFLALWIIYTKLIADDHPLTGLQEVRWHQIYIRVELCPNNQSNFGKAGSRLEIRRQGEYRKVES